MRFKQYINESLPKVLYHGTVGDLKLKPGILYLTPDKDAADLFGNHFILQRDRKGKPQTLKIKPKDGKIKNIDDAIFNAFENDEDVDDVIETEANKARKEGYRYLQFDHGGEFDVYVSLYPDKDLLMEEYVTSFDAGSGISLSFTGGYTEVFKNPSKKEIKQAADKADGNVRWFLDLDNGDFYCWKASTIHYSVEKQANLGLNNWIQGVAEYKNGKLYEVNTDNEYWDFMVTFKNKYEEDHEKRPEGKDLSMLKKWVVVL